MSDAYVIEVADQTAGIVVREPNQAGFKFFSATAFFNALEGIAFADPSAAERVASHFFKHGTLPGDINIFGAKILPAA